MEKSWVNVWQEEELPVVAENVRSVISYFQADT